MNKEDDYSVISKMNEKSGRDDKTGGKDDDSF